MQIVTLPRTYLRFPIPQFDYSSGCILAGGAVRDSIQNKSFKDLDIFGPSRDVLQFFRERNLDPLGYKKVVESKFAETYVKQGAPLVQLVFRDFDGDYSKMFGRFPFTVNQFAYDGENIVTTPIALADTLLGFARIQDLNRNDLVNTQKRLDRLQVLGYIPVESARERILEALAALSPEEYFAQSQSTVRRTGVGGDYVI